MKRTAFLLFLLAFAGCIVQFSFLGDSCPLHQAPRGNSVNPPHHHAPAVCLCFWSFLALPRPAGFLAADVFRGLIATELPAVPGILFVRDIARPPRLLPA